MHDDHTPKPDLSTLRTVVEAQRELMLNKQERWKLRSIHGSILSQASNVMAVVEVGYLTDISRRELSQSLRHLADQVDEIPARERPKKND